MKVIAGSSNIPFAKSLAKKLGLDVVEVKLNKFANGEKRVHVTEDVQGEDLILVQSFSEPVDEHIIEFLLIADALERLGAKEVFAAIPWLGYSLQDKVFNNGEALSANVIANLISNSYIRRVFLLDVHNPSVAGFFSVPTHHISTIPMFQKYIQENYDLEQLVIASPDFGGLKRAWQLAKGLKVDLVNIDKRRNLQSGEIVQMELHGEVSGKTAIVLDDVIVSGGTLVEAAQILVEAGAKQVDCLATHGLLVTGADEKLNESKISKVIMSNSVNHQGLSDKFELVDAATAFAEQLKGWL